MDRMAKVILVVVVAAQQLSNTSQAPTEGYTSADVCAKICQDNKPKDGSAYIWTCGIKGDKSGVCRNACNLCSAMCNLGDCKGSQCYLRCPGKGTGRDNVNYKSEPMFIVGIVVVAIILCLFIGAIPLCVCLLIFNWMQSTNRKNGAAPTPYMMPTDSDAGADNPNGYPESENNLHYVPVEGTTTDAN